MVNSTSLLHGSLRSPDLGGVGTGLSNRATALAAGRHSLTGDGGTERLSVSPGAAVAIQRLVCDTDLTSVLPTISAPTLVIAHAGNLYIPPSWVGSWRSTSRPRATSSWLGRTTSTGSVMSTASRTRSKSSSRARRLSRSLTDCSPRCSSPTPPTRRRRGWHRGAHRRPSLVARRARPDPGLTDGRRSRRRVRHRLPRSWRSRPQGRPPTMAAPRRRGLTRPVTVSDRALDHRRRRGGGRFGREAEQTEQRRVQEDVDGADPPGDDVEHLDGERRGRPPGDRGR